MSEVDRKPMSSSELEQAIVERRAHLTATLDEMSRRLQPARLVAVTREDATSAAKAQFVDVDTGRPRIERIVVVAGATVLVLVLTVVGEVRSRRRRKQKRIAKLEKQLTKLRS